MTSSEDQIKKIYDWEYFYIKAKLQLENEYFNRSETIDPRKFYEEVVSLAETMIKSIKE